MDSSIVDWFFEDWLIMLKTQKESARSKLRQFSLCFLDTLFFLDRSQVSIFVNVVLQLASGYILILIMCELFL